MFDTIAFLDVGTPELLIILLIILLLFGAKKLPELSKSLGESMKELRSQMKDSDRPDVTDTSRQSKTESDQQ